MAGILEGTSARRRRRLRRFPRRRRVLLHEAVETSLVRERDWYRAAHATLAAVVATVMGEPERENARVSLLHLRGGRRLHREKTRAAVRALMKLAPQTAIVRREGKEIEIPRRDIEVGEVFLASRSVDRDRRRDRVGTSSLNEAPVTGERSRREDGGRHGPRGHHQRRRRALRSERRRRLPTTRSPASSRWSKTRTNEKERASASSSNSAGATAPSRSASVSSWRCCRRS